MLKKTLTWKPFFSEDEVSKTYYFNMDLQRLADLNTYFGGDFAKTLQEIMAKEDLGGMLNAFKKVAVFAIGFREGDSFVRDDTKAAEFESSEAMEVLLNEMLVDGGVSFIDGVMPASLMEQVRNNQATQPTGFSNENRPPTSDHMTKQLPQNQTPRYSPGDFA